MSICTTLEAIEEIKKGRMIILIDDEDRENEGDLTIAAEFITPEIINFMATYGRGLICLALSQEYTEKLDLPLMTSKNASRFGTNFTISIEARDGVTTGISAKDRATTILTAIRDGAKAEDIVSPGHIFPLKAQSGGVLTRAGQTEGSVDFAKLAGLKNAAVICEIMRDDGEMARLPDLEKFAIQHNLKIATIRDLIRHRLEKGQVSVARVAEAKMPTRYGDFKIIAYENKIDSETHIALVKGELDTTKPTLVRVHSECLTGDALGSLRCDCGGQLAKAMSLIEKNGSGAILYMRQEGRGIGLANKIKAYALQDQGYDTVEANRKLGFQADLRDYGVGAQILVDLGIKNISLLTNNPKKIIGLEAYGINIVDRVAIELPSNDLNHIYLETKKNKLGHLLHLENNGENNG